MHYPWNFELYVLHFSLYTYHFVSCTVKLVSVNNINPMDLNWLPPVVSGISLGFAAAVQPGPLSMYLISQTLRAGWRKTLPAVFSPLISDGPIAVFCLFIITRFPSSFLQYLQIAGGIFILWLAWQTLRAWKDTEKKHSTGTATGPGSSPARRVVLKAAFVNFLNPGPYIGWSMVIGPLFLKSWKISPVLGAGMLGCFYITIFATTAAIMLIFHLARERGPRLRQGLIGISGAVLCIFGLYMIVSGVLAYV
jgi:threonine/homoserine/homoserine lactone efflux protein